MATRYWVGNGGNWSDNTNHWSASSGGASGASSPTISDDVVFDSNSFSTSGQTVTIDSGISLFGIARNMDWSAVTNNPILAGVDSCRIDGSLTFSSAMTVTYSATITCTTSGSVSIASAGLTLPFAYSFVGSGGTGDLSLADNLTIRHLQAQTFGNFTTNNHNVTITDGGFSFEHCAVTLGTSIINVTINTASGSQLAFQEGSVSGAASTIFLGGTASPVIFQCTLESGDLGAVNFTSGSILFQENSYTGSFSSLSVSPGVTVTLQTDSANTFSVGTFTANGTSASHITIQSNTTAQRTISATSASVSYIDVSYSNASGVAIPFNDFGGTDNGNNTNWLFPSTFPTYNTSLVTAVQRTPQNLSSPSFVLGGRNASTYKLFKKSSVYGTVAQIFRSKAYQIGQDFDIVGIAFNLIPDLGAGTIVVPILYFDDSSSSSIGTIITLSTYANTYKRIELAPPNFASGVHGKSNFFLELRFFGSALAVVDLPIFIDIDIMDV